MLHFWLLPRFGHSAPDVFFPNRTPLAPRRLSSNASRLDVWPTLFMSRSMPMARRPRCRAAAICVPEPTVGSSVMPSGGVNVLHTKSFSVSTCWAWMNQFSDGVNAPHGRSPGVPPCWTSMNLFPARTARVFLALTSSHTTNGASSNTR